MDNFNITCFGMGKIPLLGTRCRINFPKQNIFRCSFRWQGFCPDDYMLPHEFYFLHLKIFFMKPVQSTPPSLSTPLLLLALLLFVTCVVLGLSSCNSNPYQEESTQTDTAMGNQNPPTPPPPIDSMGADSINGYPVEQK